VGKYIIRNGELEGRRFRLEPGARITLGRERGDLIIRDNRMSRRHCILDAREDGDYVEDAKSTNGTWVNNRKIKDFKLTPGDIIRVGFTELEFLGTPEHRTSLIPEQPGPVDPKKTVAFRPVAPLAATRPGPGAVEEPPTESDAGAGPVKTPGRRRGGKSRVMAAKQIAMGLKGGGREGRLISAKGKFCEACGEAIFLKEGAADEGMVVDGLYLCRMCALIARKQKELGADYLPSYAKIVGGRVHSNLVPEAAPGPDGPAAEIVEVDEVRLEELTGPAEQTPSRKPGEPAPAPDVGNVAAGDGRSGGAHQAGDEDDLVDAAVSAAIEAAVDAAAEASERPGAPDVGEDRPADEADGAVE